MKDFYQQSPCPICGNREYSWGTFVGYSLFYMRDHASLLEKLTPTKNTKARHCDACGNVQIFTLDEIEETND